MGPLINIIKVRFLLPDDIWRERHFTAPLCAVTGPIGSGTSTALECLFYVLGLSKGDVAEMPPMTACKELQLLCTISGVPWTITRVPAAGNVVFREVRDGGRVKPFPLTGKKGHACAGDFVLELLGIPRAQRSGARLGLPQLMRAMYLQEGTISTHLFGGLNTEERKLVFDVLLGLRDEELQRLEDACTEAERAYATPSRLLNQLTKRRTERGLDHPDTVVAEQGCKQAELDAARKKARSCQEQLSDIAAHRGRLELAVSQARQQEKTARQAAEKAQQEAEQAATALAEARGYLRGLKRGAARRTHCSECQQELPARPAGHCCQCGQPAAGADGMRQDALDEAQARIDLAALTASQRRAHHAHAVQLARQAEEKTQKAEVDLARHERDQWKPNQQRTLDAENRVNYLAGEITQLQERLKEIQLLIDLTVQVEPLRQARATAREALEAARRERDTRRKDRILLWSQHLLKHARAILPGIDQAYVDPDSYTTVIGHKSFGVCSVAGGERILHNVCGLLALQDVGREVPDTLIPSLLVIDCPGYGSDTNDLDRTTATRLFTEILGQTHDDRTQILLATQSLPTPDAAAGVRRIPLSHEHRFFDDAPHSASHAD
ncbi:MULTISPECIES: hypothetical protein [unclassified Streptomyces]|uniref:hypothetical protein n=1 Tax=unclassified Streptomyces TaxID=2593676 RepID=UPI00131C9FBC|nr:MULTISPECIES: hypothetical protein [unclassified Streptomyces]MYX22967.1 hypothetical protein [Streptomyces sp. SID8380]